MNVIALAKVALGSPFVDVISTTRVFWSHQGATNHPSSRQGRRDQCRQQLRFVHPTYADPPTTNLPTPTLVIVAAVVMFLIPACVSLASDSLILYLHGSLQDDVHQEQEQGQQRETDDALHKIGYLTLFAWLRILVLLFPFLFHSYTGTALPCHVVYLLWYSFTLVCVLSHMLALSLMYPQSLQALVPEPEGHLEHLHLYRRLWYTLLLSVASHLAHFVLVLHVKSSAPRWSNHRHGGSNAKPPPISLYFAIRANPTDWQNNHHDEPALVQAMNEFVVDMQTKLARTQQEWLQRWLDFSNRYNPRNANINNNTAGGGSAQSRQTFATLLQLFAYQDVLENGQLNQVWQADGGRAITFLVPQLISFLLHGAATATSKPLEEWILQKCRTNLQFAHYCYWFLRAWCLEVPVLAILPGSGLSRNNSEGQLSRRSSLNSSIASHSGLVPFLDEPAFADVTTMQQHCGDSVSRLLSPPSHEGGIKMVSSVDKFWPEERMIIEQFMLNVKECGQEAALAYMVGKPGTSSESNEYLMEDGFHEDATVLDKNCALPVHPHAGTISARHLQTLSSPRRYGFLPIGYAQQYRFTAAAASGSTEAFDETPRFWDSLIHLADSLFEVDRKQRKNVLRQSLQILECETLPHNAIYVPLHHVPHRVWRIVAEESIPLGTKERVPCILTLEVVQMSEDATVMSNSATSSFYSNNNDNDNSQHYPACRGRRRRSTFLTLLDHLPGRVRSGGSYADYSLENYNNNINMTDEEHHHNDEDEFDMVEEWRFKPRHPLRRVPFMNKVADTMKGGLIRVSTTVRERLERDRTVSEELQALTLAESLVTETPDFSDSERRTKNRRRKSVRREEGSDHDEDGRDLDRVNSGNSLQSMGQWGTPKPQRPTVEMRAGSPDNLNAVRRRIDRDVASTGDILHSSNTNGLVYGSDHEEDLEKGFHESLTVPPLHSRHASADAAAPVKGSTSEKTRPPPVVFRESWQAKQDRIRATSAYGKHPGWRLLPVLVKANDDLRQEQLASQLIYKMASILAHERCPVWLCPYEILALTDSGGIIEAIPDTISLDSLKRNDPNFTNLRDFFHSYYGEDTTALANAKANFVESLAAYSMVCFLLQIKDRHNGNILLDSQGHMVHIDFGFYFLSSPGKNAGFESAPFKLTREFVDVLDGPKSHLFHVFRELCVRSFLALRKHCMEIILLVEMLKIGNEQLKCFRGRPDDAIAQLRERFRLDLNDRACREYVYSLIDNSIENWRTDWYDRYQRYFVGVL